MQKPRVESKLYNISTENFRMTEMTTLLLKGEFTSLIYSIMMMKIN